MLILFSIVACQDNKIEFIELEFEKDLFPEGIAIDSKTKKLFLNSLQGNKIVSSNLKGEQSQTFLKSNEYGYLSGFGMTVKGDTLYALGNTLPKPNNRSVLLLLHLPTGNLIDSYTIEDSTFQYLNDLTISSKNVIFITDSESNKIHKINRPNKTLETYLDSENITNSNGITISDNGEYLYLASRKGICIVETSTKKLVNEPNEDYSGIDGLKYYNGNLYGIVNGWRDNTNNGFFKFKLNENGTKVSGSSRILEFTESFKVPTTFDISDQHFYFVINTQLDNFDENTNRVIDEQKLESLKLIKVKAE